MKLLLAEIKASVANEYARAVEKFGKTFNSSHEGYAVILEEYDEARDEDNTFSVLIKSYWEEIKRNNNLAIDDKLKLMREIAACAAAEWVQVAAMCHKASIKKEDSENETTKT